MLHEVQNARQVEGEGFRRWFTDQYLDLIVWYAGDDASHPIEGFQLCYDKAVKERALTWRRNRGFLHEKVDDGEVMFAAKMTPVLVPDGLFDARLIASRFKAESGEIDGRIAKLVLDTLARYPA